MQLDIGCNGSYAYVDDLDEVQELFGEHLTTTLQEIALNAIPVPQAERRGEAQVDLNPKANEVAVLLICPG